MEPCTSTSSRTPYKEYKGKGKEAQKPEGGTGPLIPELDVFRLGWKTIKEGRKDKKDKKEKSRGRMPPKEDSPPEKGEGSKQPEQPEQVEDPVVIAKGLTHGKMHLVPLEVAQRDQRIRLHGIVGEGKTMRCTMGTSSDGDSPKLISLWEAQAQREIVYRSVLAPRTGKKTGGKSKTRKVARK